jgi:non-specific serine/threonine protein kinase
MIRRQPLATAVRTPESDEDTLRVVASCANEVLDALSLPAARIAPALQKVVGRYGRLLNFGVRELLAALQAEPAEAGRTDVSTQDPPPAAPMAAAAPSSLRSRVP